MAQVIAVSGFMGAGKSVVGASVASALGWEFVDLDEVISTATGLSPEEIFASRGEIGFRAVELECLKEIVGRETTGPGLVLALGGGAITSPEAAAVLAENALVVFLPTSPAVGWGRVEGSGRPLARSWEDFAALAAVREPVYLKTADEIVQTHDLSAAEVAARVVDIARRRFDLDDPGADSVGDPVGDKESGR